MPRNRLSKQLATLPDSPGVYLFKDTDDRIVYVGKGRSLRKRVRSYFTKSHADARVRLMISHIADLDFYVTDSEVESLILEVNLIKQHRPPYNINYRDDKSYPYIAIDLDSDYPCVRWTRERHKKGTRYFGPYTNAKAVRETVATLRKIFPIRSCRGVEPGKSTGCPCLDYHIERCLGPCIGAVTPEDYGTMIDQIVSFLDGKQEKVISRLRTEMGRASAATEYERAAMLRNRIRAAEHVRERQKIVSESRLDQDIIAVAIEDEIVCAQLFAVREGKIVSTEEFILSRGIEDARSEVIAGFLKTYYLSAGHIPARILLPIVPVDDEVLGEWLGRLRGRSVRFEVPRRGAKKQLVEMAYHNAELALSRYKAKTHYEEERANRALAALQRELGLAKPPMRIECFDISQIAGTSAVGSMVVFVAGTAKPSAYKRFRIRAVRGQNDFEMMKQVVSRRLARLADIDPRKFGERPDLVIVDGGKPQLSAALEAMATAAAASEAAIGVGDIPLAALAKREEEVFLPGREEPVRLAAGSDELHLIQRVRDEAHRFALAYHRNLRGKRMSKSILDDVEGIGPARKKLLLAYFGSNKAIANADLDALRAVPGIPAGVAHSLYRHLHSAAS